MSIDPEEVFAAVEAYRASGELSKKVTVAKQVYQCTDRPSASSRSIETGARTIGMFADDVFTRFHDDADSHKQTIMVKL